MICCVFYFSVVALIGSLAGGHGGGEKLRIDGKVVGYELIGQEFTQDKYFRGRPSAVSYNAAGSGGSNKGATNPDYLKVLQDRIDSFLLHNPGVKKEAIPAELITASGSGLDPHISPASAAIQIERIATARNLSKHSLQQLIEKHTRRPLLGPPVVNVLKLNIALESYKVTGH